MYKNDCRLTSYNGNCDIPIHFRMPACQMMDDHKMSAKSWHNFLPHCNSKTTGLNFTNFLHDVEALVELLMCTHT